MEIKILNPSGEREKEGKYGDKNAQPHLNSGDIESNSKSAWKPRSGQWSSGQSFPTIHTS